MGKSYMLAKEQVSGLGVAEIRYVTTQGNAPVLSGPLLKVFVWMMENPVTGRAISSKLKTQNHITKVLSNTVIPDAPMFLPEFPSEAGLDERLVVSVSETSSAASRVATTSQCLPPVPANAGDNNECPYLYWTIRDYAEAYKSLRLTPSEVAERFIQTVGDPWEKIGTKTLFCSFDSADIRQQAAVSSERCAAGGTTWLSKVRGVREDAVCVSRLRECGAILAGKTNMNELGMGVSGNNPHYGCVRNPHDTTRYSGGSAAGSVAVVSCGLCPAAVATIAESGPEMGKQGADFLLNFSLQNGKVSSNHHPTIVSQYGSHRGGVHAVQFRPQMKHLVSGGSDSAVYLWSLHCRANLRHPVVRPYRFLGHHGPVYSVAVSPCDNLIASGSQDKTIRLWIPTVEGKCSTIRGHTGPVRTVNFSHDGQFLLSGSDDKTIKIWKVSNQKFLCALSGHMNWVQSAEFNADRRLILSGSDDKSVRLWDVEKGECVQQFTDVLGLVNSVRFHPDNCCVASGNSDRCIQMWDVRSKNLIQHYAANAGAVNSVCFHPSGNYLLSSCDDATLKIWDMREGQIVFTLQGHDGATQSAEFSSSGEYFASGSADEHVLLWRTNIDLTGCQPDRGFIGKEVVGHVLCNACNCVCTNPPNEGGIHCPKRANTVNEYITNHIRVTPHADVVRKGSSFLCKLASSQVLTEDADISIRCPAKLDDADETAEEDTPRTTVLVHRSILEELHKSDSTSIGADEGESDIQQQGSRNSNHQSDGFECDVKRRSCKGLGSSSFLGTGRRICIAPRARSTFVSSANDVKSFGSTLKQICHQLSVLTRTVALFEERLSHSEDKMIRIERLSGELTPDEESEDPCNIHG